MTENVFLDKISVLQTLSTTPESLLDRVKDVVISERDNVNGKEKESGNTPIDIALSNNSQELEAFLIKSTAVTQNKQR